MNTPRRQHLLPQFYLRRFADQRRVINVLPRAGQPGATKPYTANITNVLVERDYYTITDETGAESFVVEQAFATLEAAASNSLRILLDEGLALSDRDRSAWSEFMALQVTRGRQFREVYDDFTERLVKSTLRTVATNAPDEYFEQISADLIERGEDPLPVMTAQRRQQMVKGDAFDVKPSKEHTIEMSMVALEEMTAIFFQMSWKLLRFDTPCLFTSDHPVVYWREPSPLDRMGGIGPMTAREVRIPLGTSAALVLAHPFEIDDADDAEHRGGPVIARCLNRDLLRWPASKQWLTSPDVPTHPVPLTSAAWRDEWARPWVRRGRYT